MVELIVVIVIIGILAAAAGPMFFNVEVFRGQGFIDEVLSAVRYAQKHAVATGCTVRVVTAANQLTLYGPANQAACQSGPFGTVLPDPSGGAATFIRTAPDGVVLSAADFTFLPGGTATVAYPSLTINIGDRTFTVFQQTGFVRTP